MAAAPSPLRPSVASYALVISALLLSAPVPLLAQSQYAAVAHGGNYMHNFYFPPAPQLHPMVPGLVARWPKHCGRDERVDLERRP